MTHDASVQRLEEPIIHQSMQVLPQNHVQLAAAGASEQSLKIIDIQTNTSGIFESDKNSCASIPMPQTVSQHKNTQNSS